MGWKPWVCDSFCYHGGMLFFLTGDIQTGKTRWLQALRSTLDQRGVGVCGVIAPGVWIEHVADDGEVSYEKMGIENVLLPEGTRVAFARRRDLAVAEGAFDARSQAARSQLGWAIDDGAIAVVNEHLSHLLAGENVGALQKRNLLVIDELGRLELHAGEGLVAAVALVDRGATEEIPHALIIVREQLLDVAMERFASAPWGGMCAIAPNSAGERAVLDAFAVMGQC